MIVEQIVEVPASRRIFLDLPEDLPIGRVKVTVTPEADINDCPLCAKHRDPETGELRPNAETAAAIREGRAMMRGEIPAKRFNSLNELLEDLRS